MAGYVDPDPLGPLKMPYGLCSWRETRNDMISRPGMSMGSCVKGEDGDSVGRRRKGQALIMVLGRSVR